jgi:ribosomal-protein-alanine N-acetyltransferase
MTSPLGHRIGVVAMGAKHLDAVMAIDAQVYPKPWSRKLWRREIDLDTRLYRVAVDAGAVVGHIGMMFVGEDAHIMTVAVDPAHQGHKVATRLLSASVPVAIEVGAHALTLEVRASNTGAQALYRKFGLAPVGMRKAYYEPDGEDALVMWADDITSDAYRRRLDTIVQTLETAAC